MTPAVEALKKAGVTFQVREYAHDPRTRAYGEEAAASLGVAPESVFKTLFAKLDGKTLVVGIVPVTASLNLKALAKATGGKRAEMAPASEAERATGYVVGGISPFGQKKRHTTVLDRSALSLEVIHVSGGKRGLEIVIAPHDLLAVLTAHAAEIV